MDGGDVSIAATENNNHSIEAVTNQTKPTKAASKTPDKINNCRKLEKKKEGAMTFKSIADKLLIPVVVGLVIGSVNLFGERALNQRDNTVKSIHDVEKTSVRHEEKLNGINETLLRIEKSVESNTERIEKSMEVGFKKSEDAANHLSKNLENLEKRTIDIENLLKNIQPPKK